MNLIPVPCRYCKIEVYVPSEYSMLGVVCEICSAEDEKRRRRERETLALDERWVKLCPEAYRNTEFMRLPCGELSTKAMGWAWNHGKGLNMWGWPRTGKTRTMFLVLQREHFAGRSVKVFGPGDFANGLELRNYKSAPWIKQLCQYDIIAFDDVDKCRMRTTHEEKFFTVIDYRLRHNKPTFYTGNANGAELKTKFKNGEALVARIRESSLSIHFPKPL